MLIIELQHPMPPQLFTTAATTATATATTNITTRTAATCLLPSILLFFIATTAINMTATLTPTAATITHTRITITGTTTINLASPKAASRHA